MHATNTHTVKSHRGIRMAALVWNDDNIRVEGQLDDRIGMVANLQALLTFSNAISTSSWPLVTSSTIELRRCSFATRATHSATSQRYYVDINAGDGRAIRVHLSVRLARACPTCVGSLESSLLTHRNDSTNEQRYSLSEATLVVICRTNVDRLVYLQSINETITLVEQGTTARAWLAAVSQSHSLIAVAAVVVAAAVHSSYVVMEVISNLRGEL